MDIGKAVQSLKDGKRVMRFGWNGKNMWLSLTPGATINCNQFWSKHNRQFAYDQPNSEAEVLPYVTMKTVDNKIVPWLCSQTDLLADDWVELPDGA